MNPFTKSFPLRRLGAATLLLQRALSDPRHFPAATARR